MRILVTGAGGYVGVPVCAELLSRRHQVIGLDRYFFGQDKLGRIVQDPGFTLLVDDIRYFDLSQLTDVDAVVDLAGLSNDLSADLDPLLTRQINVQGCERVARAAKAHGVHRYVFASSASVYGSGEKEALDEADECRPQTDYARSKLAIEAVLNELSGGGFQPVILRPATIFGVAPRMRFDLAINIMTMQAWQDRVVRVTGGGRQWRPFIHVRDVVQAVVLGLESAADRVAGETFNIGDDAMNLRIDQLAHHVCEIIPHARIRHVPGSSDRRTYNLSFQKARTRLNFRARTGVTDGISEIRDALERCTVSSADPTTLTLGWYKLLLEWEKRIAGLRIHGRIL